MHNSGHFRVCATKSSSRHMGQIDGLKIRMARVSSNYNKEEKYPNLSIGSATTKYSL